MIMINVSDEYKKIIRENRILLSKLKMKLVDGTVLEIDRSKMVQGSFIVKDEVSTSGNFDIGSALSGEFKVILNNLYDEFSKFDFNGAVIRPYVGLELESSTEWVSKGVFTVEEANSKNAKINIVALDNMAKLDMLYSENTLTYPASLREIVTDICTSCGIQLGTPAFDNCEYVVSERPEDTALTCRAIVQYAAQIGGNYARCNTDGELELKWYDLNVFEQEDSLDGGNNTDYTSGDTADGGNFDNYNNAPSYDGGNFDNFDNYHHFYSLKGTDIAVDDVVVTGIKVVESEEVSYLFGNDGYVLEISNNPLIMTGNAEVVAFFIGRKIVGMRFRPVTTSTLSNPIIEAGDPAYISDHKGNTYQTYLTNVTYTSGALHQISCEAKSPAANSARPYSENSQTIVEARKLVKQEKTAREQAIEALATKLENSSGLYPTQTTQTDGSTIYYLHDKPTLTESKIVWKMTANGWGVSTDGGKTYPTGMTMDGDTILRILQVVGINADWINAGTISGVSMKIGNNFIVDSTGKVTAKDADITGGTINISTTSSSDNVITLKNAVGTATLRANQFYTAQASDGSYTEVGTGSIDVGLLTGSYLTSYTRMSKTGVSTVGSMYATSFNNTSLEETKENIEALINALDIVNTGDIYTYNFKTLLEEGIEKKGIGLVIGQNYNTPAEVIAEGGEGVDVYSMVSVLWQAVKELSNKVNELERIVMNSGNTE